MVFDQAVVLTNRPDSQSPYPNFKGGAGNDLAIAVAWGLSLSMGDGNDAVVSLGGAYAYMGNGNDVALGGSNGGNSFDGGEGDDYLAVSGGNNGLNGGSGADMLFGGSGKDTITFDAQDRLVFGGGGADTFRLDPYYNGGVARIADFDGTSPQHDILDLWMLGGVQKSDVSIFGYGDGQQLLYVNGNAADGRPAVAVELTGGYYSVDDMLASGVLVGVIDYGVKG